MRRRAAVAGRHLVPDGSVPESSVPGSRVPEVQTPAMEYFSILDLPPALAIDPGDLEKRFYARSRQLHPDRFARAPREVQQKALDESALLNDAYRTLKNPVARSEYVLRKIGLEGKELPPGFLEEMFELNMEIEEGGDRGLIQARLTEVDARLEQLSGSWDGRADSPVLRQVRLILNQRRYLENLVNPHV